MKAKTASAFMTLVLVSLAACADSGSTDGLAGSELFVEIGCQACHGEADSDVAPTLNEIWGTDAVLEDGRTVTVDEAYVTRSIEDPGADVVAGYSGRMPQFGLSESEVDRLVDYVRSLG